MAASGTAVVPAPLHLICAGQTLRCVVSGPPSKGANEAVLKRPRPVLRKPTSSRTSYRSRKLAIASIPIRRAGAASEHAGIFHLDTGAETLRGSAHGHERLHRAKSSPLEMGTS